jgi:hypothetical protein
MSEVIFSMKRYGGKRSFFFHHADLHQPIIPIEEGFFPGSPPPGIALIQAHRVKQGKNEVKKNRSLHNL